MGSQIGEEPPHEHSFVPYRNPSPPRKGVLRESPDNQQANKDRASITVAGVTFTADQVISAVVKIDEREIEIKAKPHDANRIGF